jgi:putative membrane protein
VSAHQVTGLPALTAPGLFTHFSVDPIVLVGALGAAFWYARGLRRLAGLRRGSAWPRRRTASFAAGILLTVWVSCGGMQAYAPSLFWIWTAQILTLLLVAPILLIAGQPVELDRRLGGGVVSRVVASPVAAVIGNPFVGPALIPVLSAVLFFGPLPGWSVQAPVVSWVVAFLATVVGCIIVLPVLDIREVRTSVVVGLAMAIGFFELLLDAIPGIVLRLETHQASTFFDHRRLHSWSPGWLHDQQLAGAVLWTVAEVLDLPFLVVLFVRWYRTDQREANNVDAVLDAEQIVRSAHSPRPERPSESDDAAPDAVEPWWLSDPRMRERMRRRP